MRRNFYLIRILVCFLGGSIISAYCLNSWMKYNNVDFVNIWISILCFYFAYKLYRQARQKKINDSGNIFDARRRFIIISSVLGIFTIGLYDISVIFSETPQKIEWILLITIAGFVIGITSIYLVLRFHKDFQVKSKSRMDSD